MILPIPHRAWIKRLMGMVVVLAAAGCQCASPRGPTTAPTTQATPGLTPLKWNSDVLAQCDPPVGWVAQPLERDCRHTEQLWISPSNDTAYGIGHFNLPLPVGLIGIDRVLQGIVDDMASKEKSATVVSRQTDPNLPGLRLEIKGGLYDVRANLIVSGWEGWFVYASTSNDDPTQQKELDLAQLARDHTIVGVRPGQ
jgi:hypothetical protein